jgi:5-methylcytosine-specific restriction protein A
MPLKAPRPCCTPGCPNLTSAGRCGICTKGRERTRGSASQRGYAGKQYTAWRDEVITRDAGLCQCCLSLGIVEPGNVADHIISRESGGAQYDVENGQTLDARCHNIKRAAESRGRQMQIQQGKGWVDIGPLGTPAVRWIECATRAA